MSDPADTRAAPPSHAGRWPVAIAKKLGRVIPEAVERFFADQCPQQAAGIAYRVLFSIAPLAIVLVSIFGLVLRDDSVREDVVNTIVDALPVSAAGRHDVEDAITAIATPASAAGLLSLLVFAWAASGMMTAIRQGLERALAVTESRPPARGKLVDLLLIVGAAILVLVTAGITLLGNLVQKTSGKLGDLVGVGAGTLASGLVHTALFALSIVVVLLLYRFVPARGLRFRDGLVGAIVTALLLRLIALASAWIYERTSRLSVVYGSLTSALVFLYSMYLYSSALLLGAEVAAAWSRLQPSGGEPILTQLKRGLLGLFVRQKVSPVDERLPDAASDRAPGSRSVPRNH
ncbi:MAG TPA: YihY/virulence factor BrkB family protein [Gaiellaceae bacterium]|nr:YihY/virulence factor BrkB family protein [Gaiellaceae bacterium]